MVGRRISGGCVGRVFFSSEMKVSCVFQLMRDMSQLNRKGMRFNYNVII